VCACGCACACVPPVQGNIAAWRKAEGDSVAPGDILAEIETDKATIEWEAQEEGFIAKILKPAGQSAHSIGSFKQRGGFCQEGCVCFYTGFGMEQCILQQVHKHSKRWFTLSWGPYLTPPPHTHILIPQCNHCVCALLNPQCNHCVNTHRQQGRACGHSSGVAGGGG
jgi:hypothetical protein